MAIKVINRQKNSQRTRCGNCGVELEYLVSDTTQRYVPTKNQSNRVERFLKCKECGKEIPVGNY
jgi:uncharacterized protein with PIN domain